MRDMSNVHIYTIRGNIAVGKSVLTGRLKLHYKKNALKGEIKFIFLMEPVDATWRWLLKCYSERQTEMNFVLLQVHIYLSLFRRDLLLYKYIRSIQSRYKRIVVVQERDILDSVVFLLLNSKMFSMDNTFKLYTNCRLGNLILSVFNSVCLAYPFKCTHATLYLKRDAADTLLNIQMRGREGEENITVEFQHICAGHHDTLLKIISFFFHERVIIIENCEINNIVGIFGLLQ